MRLINADEFPTKHANTGENDYEIGFDDGVQMMLDEIQDAPTVDAVPVIHGHWVANMAYYCDESGVVDYKCSECSSYVVYEEYLPNYCPNCGAKMEEKDGEHGCLNK